MITFIHRSFSLVVPHVGVHEKSGIFKDHIEKHGKEFIALEGPTDHRMVHQAQCKITGKLHQGDLIEIGLDVNYHRASLPGLSRLHDPIETHRLI